MIMMVFIHEMTSDKSTNVNLDSVMAWLDISGHIVKKYVKNMWRSGCIILSQIHLLPPAK